MNTIKSLKNKLLIAMPDLQDPYFSQSVVYLYEHGPEGAMGFIINKPMDITIKDILERADITDEVQAKESMPMLLGGPLKQEQLFMIFSEKASAADKSLQMASQEELLRIVAARANPNNMMAFLGYASWTSGQLEAEIKQNSWLISPVEHALLYEVPFDQRYQMATDLMGFRVDQLSSVVGHA